MTNALSIYGQFDQIQQAAIALQQSGYFSDVKSQAQAIVKVMAGAELGLPPFASMTGIHIIQGKPALGSNVIATLVKNDPRYDYQIKICDNEICTLAWFENNKPVGSSTFTMTEAKDAGLTGKDNWRKYPSDMLFARAISRGARRFAPGIFGGSPVYTPEELGADVDPEGYIDATAEDVTEEPPATVKAADKIAEAERSLKVTPLDATGKFNPVEAIVAWGYAENNHAAAAILNKSPYSKGGMSPDDLQKWAARYRGWRDSGLDTDEAVKKATAGQIPE